MELNLGQFKRDFKNIYTRTANTLRKDRVEFVKETIINDRAVTILKLGRRVKRIHYIVYFDSDLTEEMYDWEDVIVLTEIEHSDHRFRTCIRPSNQFPDLNLNDQEIHDHLEKLLTTYEKSTNISHVER